MVAVIRALIPRILFDFCARRGKLVMFGHHHHREYIMLTLEKRIDNLQTFDDCHFLALQLDPTIRPNSKGAPVQRFLAGWLHALVMFDEGKLDRDESSAVMAVVRG